jgi:hypothetical protein
MAAIWVGGLHIRSDNIIPSAKMSIFCSSLNVEGLGVAGPLNKPSSSNYHSGAIYLIVPATPDFY